MKKGLTVFTILIIVQMLLLAATYFARFEFAIFLNKSSFELIEVGNNSITKEVHSFSIRNDIFREYLYSKGVPKHVVFFEDDTLDSSYKTAVDIFEYSENKNINIEIVARNYRTEERVEVLENEVELNKDENLPVSASYTDYGSDGKEVYSEKIEYVVDSKVERKVNQSELVSREEPVNDQKYEGTLSEKEFKNQQKSIVVAQFGLEALSLLDIVWDEDIKFEQDKFKLGKSKVLFDNCSYYFLSDLQYARESGEFQYEKIENLETFVCESPIKYSDPVEIATCLDCLTFPVDKKHRLTKEYTPEVGSLSSFGSVYELNVDAIEDFANMWEDLKSEGFNPNITSAYRSYQNQVETFDYWVDLQKNLYGYSQSEAEERANTVSARAGFSEHQLGTTVDLNAIECEAFTGTCSYNENMWKWLNSNSYKYGFIRSYPEGKELETGYVSEPWHLRWLGVDLAKEYYSQREKITLNKFLDRRRY